MRNYSFDQNYIKLLTPVIVALMSQIHEYKGEQAIFIESEADTLTQLVEAAKMQSTDASNKIEGICTSDERLKKLVLDKTMPRTRNEQEIAGYRDVLAAICVNYDYLPLTPSTILSLHRDLYKFRGAAYGGSFKSGESGAALERLCRAYGEAVETGGMDALLLIPMFVLDFLCIHPFNDGNGRMSRLLALLLLYRAGYMVGKYISIEKLIEESKGTYYEALQRSSAGWHDGQNDYSPFVRYMLGIIVAAYRDFSERARALTIGDMSKPERIRELIRSTLGKITKAQIIEQCPDISGITIQRTLSELQKSGEIIKLSGGRYTAYTWNRERE